MRELAKRGHKITLYAPSGSKILGVKIKKISPFQTSLIRQKYANLQERITSFYDLNAFADFFSSGEDKNFDLIYCCNYIFYEILPFTKWTKKPVIIQINYPHGSIYPYMKDYLKKFKNVHYMPMSHFIKSVMPHLPYSEPIYPVFDFKDFPFSKKSGDSLLFIGRICPEKGPHLAIEAVQKSKRKLIIAGGVGTNHHEYFNRKIKPFVDGKKIVYVGEVDFKTKIKLYQKSLATLFPIQWDEPFGIVLVESMACGTPVIAFDRAAVREIVKNGKNGFVVPDGDTNKIAAKIKDISKLNRLRVRQWAEKKFSLKQWVDKYERICQSLIRKKI
jgi:glycosyltransferase involved in cell wall biosynthesis